MGRAPRRFQRLVKRVAVWVCHCFERLVKSQRLQHRDAHAYGSTRVTKLKRSEGVSVDVRLAGQISNRPTAADSRDADALAELGGSLGCLQGVRKLLV